MTLHDVLMEKAKKSELAHFYIVEPTGNQVGVDRALQEFVHHFIRDYYQKIEGHKQSLGQLMDHPDVQVMGNLVDNEEREEKFFTVEESELLNRFFEFRPVQSKRKFAIITEAHRISGLVANKWLKLLEEPSGAESTIFLLNPRRQKLLDTIHSRAIHLRLPVHSGDDSSQTWEEFLKDVQKFSLSQFLENYQRGEHSLSFWTDKLISWEAGQINGPQEKAALQEWLKNFQEMEVFHQPAATKWSLFYSYLHQHVLPRITR